MFWRDLRWRWFLSLVLFLNLFQTIRYSSRCLDFFDVNIIPFWFFFILILILLVFDLLSQLALTHLSEVVGLHLVKVHGVAIEEKVYVCSLDYSSSILILKSVKFFLSFFLAHLLLSTIPWFSIGPFKIHFLQAVFHALVGPHVVSLNNSAQLKLLLLKVVIPNLLLTMPASSHAKSMHRLGWSNRFLLSQILESSIAIKVSLAFILMSLACTIVVMLTIPSPSLISASVRTLIPILAIL